MNIDVKKQYPTLWYENDDGYVFIPDFRGSGTIIEIKKTTEAVSALVSL